MPHVQDGRILALISLLSLYLKTCRGQIELAPANMGLKLTPPESPYVKNVPGRNPNMPAWFEDLGVESFGEILGDVDVESMQKINSVQTVLDRKSEGSSGADGPSDDLLSSGHARNLLNSDESLSSSSGDLGNSTIPISSNSTIPVSSNSTIPISSNSTDTSTEIVEKVFGIPYPAAEEKTRKKPTAHKPVDTNSSTSDQALSSDYSDPSVKLLPSVEELEKEQKKPKLKSIPLWKPRAKGPEPPPLYILPADNAERRISTNIDMLRPIVGTSTFTTKVAGQVVTSTTVSTLDPRAMKFKSCIYGCPEMTSTDELVGTTTIITVLPYQIPCSLVSCPPCPACFQSTVKVSVCPVITTVPGKERTTFVNGPTITVIRSTVTKTQCTATRTISAKPEPCTCPSLSASTETVTVTMGKVLRSKSSSGSLFDDNSSGLESPLVDPGLILDYPESSEDHPVTVIQKDGLLSTITETIMSTVYATPSKTLPSLTITKTVVSDRVVVTVTTTLLPVTPVTTEDANTGVCSTFIICNPTQFTCPAQVTNLPQIKSVVEAIMLGQEKFGSGGVGSRKISPNGAFLDEMGPEGVYGDGIKMAGGLAPVNAFGFGPGGMFEKILGSDLIAPAETSHEVLLPPQPTVKAAEMKISATVAKPMVSSTRIVEAMATDAGGEGQARRSAIKKAKKQTSDAITRTLPILAIILSISAAMLII